MGDEASYTSDLHGQPLYRCAPAEDHIPILQLAGKSRPEDTGRAGTRMDDGALMYRPSFRSEQVQERCIEASGITPKCLMHQGSNSPSKKCLPRVRNTRSRAFMEGPTSFAADLY